MSSSFDPYVDWLKISSHRRPPSAYELLGLAQFEEDISRIQSAFQDQYAKVRVYQVGPFSGIAQRILDELGAAFHLLSDATHKQRYDRQLSQAADALLVDCSTDNQSAGWKQVERLLDSMGRQPTSAALDEAEQLARAHDPKYGPLRLAQAALRRNLHVRPMREKLLEHAAKHSLSICGHCFQFLKAPLPSSYTPVKIARDGSIVSNSASFKLARGPFRSRLVAEIRDPTWKPLRTSSRFHDHGRRRILALGWMMIFAVGLPAALSLDGFAAWMLLAVMVGLLVLGLAMVAGRRLRREPDKVYTPLDAVWEVVVPQMLDDPVASEISFLSGLAQVSVGTEGHERRIDLVCRLAESASAMTTTPQADFDHLGRCYQLALSDMFLAPLNRSQGLLLFRSMLKKCLDGEIPFRSLEIATRKGKLFDQLPQSAIVMIRLKVLWTCIEANLSTADVITLIENSPTFRPIFHDDLRKDRNDISCYFALFKNMAWRSRLVRSAFELVAATDVATFQAHPHVLIQATDGSLLIEMRRATFRGERLKDVPDTVVRQLSPGFELELNGKRYEYTQDPTEFAAAVRRACFWFFSVLPKEAKTELDRQASDRLPASLFGDPITCPQCKTVVPFIPGELVKS